MAFPCLAECGGFMYLHTTMEDMEGNAWEMADVIDGRAYKTEKLGRFGYIELSGTQKTGVPGEKGRDFEGHEFHYFDSTSCGRISMRKNPCASVPGTASTERNPSCSVSRIFIITAIRHWPWNF